MPIVKGAPHNGQLAVTSAVPIVSGALTFAAGGGTLATQTVKANGLPALNAWFLEAVGGGAVSVELQWADGELGGLIGPVWRNLIPAYALVPGTESLTNKQLGSRLYRANVTAGAAVGGTSVRYRLTASLSQ